MPQPVMDNRSAPNHQPCAQFLAFPVGPNDHGPPPKLQNASPSCLRRETPLRTVKPARPHPLGVR